MSDTVSGAIPGPGEPANSSPRAGLLASMLSAVDPARATADAVHDKTVPGGSSAAYHDDSPETSGTKSSTGTRTQHGVIRAWLHAGAERWRKGADVRLKHLDMQKARHQANQVKEVRTVNRSEKILGGSSSTGTGARNSSSKSLNNKTSRNEPKGGPNSTTGGGRNGRNGAAGASGGSGSNGSAGGTRGGGSGKNTGGSGRGPSGASGASGGKGAQGSSNTDPRRDGSTGPAKQPKSDSRVRDRGSSGAPGKTGPQGAAGSAGKNGSGGGPSASGKGGTTNSPRSGKEGGRDKVSLDKPGAKTDGSDSCNLKARAGKTQGAGKDGAPGTTPTSKAGKAGKAQPTGPTAVQDRGKPFSVRESRETGYRDGSRAAKAHAHVQAYGHGFKDGWADTHEVAGREKTHLDKAHQDRKQSRNEPQEQQVSGTRTSADYHQPEQTQPAGPQPVQVKHVDATHVQLGDGAARQHISRGEVRSLKGFERRLEAKSSSMTKIGDDTKVLKAHAEQQAKDATRLLEAARSVKGGEKLVGALTKLQDQAATQAAHAEEIHKRALRAGDNCRTVHSNVQTRYGGIYQAVVNSPETTPAELAFYKG